MSSSSSSSSEPLSAYHRKRDFSRTAEPSGDSTDSVARSGSRYVVQLHDARRRHFDLRLQVGDVLKSWAVPKGPSADPRDKRLAVPTEDHPLEYEDFEGGIEPGQYGAGTVLVWDIGVYRNISERRGKAIPFAEALERGHVSFWLEGRKLRGGYSLTRFRGGGNGRPGEASSDEAWLLVKRADKHAAVHHYPPSNRARSVLTGRTLRQVAEASHESENNN